MVPFNYRSQGRKLLHPHQHLILRNHLNSKEHSIVYIQLKANLEKMKKKGTDFRLAILLLWLVGVEPREAEKNVLLQLVSPKGIHSF